MASSVGIGRGVPVQQLQRRRTKTTMDTTAERPTRQFGVQYRATFYQDKTAATTLRNTASATHLGNAYGDPVTNLALADSCATIARYWEVELASKSFPPTPGPWNATYSLPLNPRMPLQLYGFAASKPLQHTTNRGMPQSKLRAYPGKPSVVRRRL